MEKQKIKKTNLIEKRNLLNEMRIDTMSFPELRFLTIYLSKINARDLNSRIVRFELTEFQKIVELGRLDVKYLKSVTNKLLQKVVNISDENGGYIGFQLFKECRVFKDNNEVWQIEIDAHDRALPLMFEIKEKYFTYQLWNILNLKSINQIRIYELLKQYEKIGERIIEVSELRLMLGIQENEYSRWNNFKTKVLDACQVALVENTDLKYEYELIRKGVGKGTGRKITHVKFIIKKNKNYENQLSLGEFIDLQSDQEIIDVVDVQEEFEEKEEHEYENNTLALLADACNNEFKNSEIKVIFNLVKNIEVAQTQYGNLIAMADFTKSCYDRMCHYSKINIIHDRFNYLQRIINTELEKLYYKS